MSRFDFRKYRFKHKLQVRVTLPGVDYGLACRAQRGPLSSQQACISLALRAPYGTLHYINIVHERGVLSEFRPVRISCPTLPGLPRAARPSGRFAEGKTPQRGNVRHCLTLPDPPFAFDANPHDLKSREGARGVQRETTNFEPRAHAACASYWFDNARPSGLWAFCRMPEQNASKHKMLRYFGRDVRHKFSGCAAALNKD